MWKSKKGHQKLLWVLHLDPGPHFGHRWYRPISYSLCCQLLLLTDFPSVTEGQVKKADCKFLWGTAKYTITLSIAFSSQYVPPIYCYWLTGGYNLSLHQERKTVHVWIVFCTTEDEISADSGLSLKKQEVSHSCNSGTDLSLCCVPCSRVSNVRHQFGGFLQLLSNFQLY